VRVAITTSNANGVQLRSWTTDPAVMRDRISRPYKALGLRPRARIAANLYPERGSPLPAVIDPLRRLGSINDRRRSG
jgi:hypothetical protein